MLLKGRNVVGMEVIASSALAGGSFVLMTGDVEPMTTGGNDLKESCGGFGRERRRQCDPYFFCDSYRMILPPPSFLLPFPLYSCPHTLYAFLTILLNLVHNRGKLGTAISVLIASWLLEAIYF